MASRTNEHKKVITLAKIRENYECEICRINVNIHGHHIVDHGFGGKPTPENILVVCKACHDKIHLGEISIATYDYTKS